MLSEILYVNKVFNIFKYMLELNNCSKSRYKCIVAPSFCKIAAVIFL